MAHYTFPMQDQSMCVFNRQENRVILSHPLIATLHSLLYQPTNYATVVTRTATVLSRRLVCDVLCRAAPRGLGACAGSCLLSMVTLLNTFVFFVSFLFSIFWASHDHRCRSLSSGVPSLISRRRFSIPTARRFSLIFATCHVPGEHFPNLHGRPVHGA